MAHRWLLEISVSTTRKPGTTHLLKWGSYSPHQAGRMGQNRAVLGIGANGIGHQGAAGPHR